MTIALFDIPTNQDNELKKKVNKIDKIEISQEKTFKPTGKYKEIEFEQIKQHNVFSIKEIFEHNEIFQSLLLQLLNNKLHNSVIIKGEYGIGKSTFVYNLISQFLIQNFSKQYYDNNKEKDLQIESIKKMLRYNIFPDIKIINDEKNQLISTDSIRSLVDFLSLKSVYSKYKFIIIDDLSLLSINAQNALLKTLEEPPQNTYIFLINHNFNEIIDTINSRCLTIKLNNIEYENLIKISFIDKQNIDICTKFSFNSAGIIKLITENLLLDDIFVFTNFFKTKNTNISLDLKKKIYFFKQKLNKINNFNNNLKHIILSNIILTIINNNKQYNEYNELLQMI